MVRSFCKTICAHLAFALVLLVAVAPVGAGVLDGLGTVGSGNAGPGATLFPDLMHTERGLYFGPSNSFALGVVGADAGEVLAPGNQVDQMVALATSGDVTLAILTLGDNDYIDVAEEIGDGTIAGAALLALHQEVATNIATAVNAVRAAGAKVVLGGFANFTDSPAAAAIKADPVMRARLLNALDDGNKLVADFATAEGIPFIDFFNLGKDVYDNGSVQIGGVDLILEGYDTDPHYFFEDPFHAGILVRAAIANFYLDAINKGYGTNLPLLSDLEILALGGLENEYVGETLADTYDFEVYVQVPEPSSFALAALSVVAMLAAGRRAARGRRCREAASV